MDPGIDGLETKTRILGTNTKYKALVANGFAKTDRVRQVIQLGAGTSVHKPYLKETLGRAIRETLNGAFQLAFNRTNYY